MLVKTPPQDFDWFSWMNKKSVFLAGSIEMGMAEKWQDRVIDAVSNMDNIVILNPRRDDWDSSWEQSINNRQFVEQVEWEHNGLLTYSDIHFFYFAPGTKSPITLQEFGMSSMIQPWRLNHIIVCPDGFWRKGNIEVTCKRLELPVYNSLDEGIKKLKEIL